MAIPAPALLGTAASAGSKSALFNKILSLLSGNTGAIGSIGNLTGQGQGGVGNLQALLADLPGPPGIPGPGAGFLTQPKQNNQDEFNALKEALKRMRSNPLRSFGFEDGGFVQAINSPAFPRVRNRV